jgi:hypothetical protein
MVQRATMLALIQIVERSTHDHDDQSEYKGKLNEMNTISALC